MSKLKNIKVLTLAAMMLAASVILTFFLRIPVNQLVEIRFESFPVKAAGMMMGPGVGLIVGALSDILCYLVKPTGAFFPGFTVSAALAGLIYGILLYKRPFSYKRVVLAQTICSLLISFTLNTLWLSILYGVTFKASFVMRFPKNIIMLPIDIVLAVLIMKPLYMASGRLVGVTGSARSDNSGK
ncbi:MAG: folate family ECF transporter S component [Eubacteriales bacterium]|nr:folate family ECF transporter S component [Eubacteriales bacterium]